MTFILIYTLDKFLSNSIHIIFIELKNTFLSSYLLLKLNHSELQNQRTDFLFQEDCYNINIASYCNEHVLLNFPSNVTA